MARLAKSPPTSTVSSSHFMKTSPLNEIRYIVLPGASDLSLPPPFFRWRQRCTPSGQTPDFFLCYLPRGARMTASPPLQFALRCSGKVRVVVRVVAPGTRNLGPRRSLRTFSGARRAAEGLDVRPCCACEY